MNFSAGPSSTICFKLFFPHLDPAVTTEECIDLECDSPDEDDSGPPKDTEWPSETASCRQLPSASFNAYSTLTFMQLYSIAGHTFCTRPKLQQQMPVVVALQIRFLQAR